MKKTYLLHLYRRDRVRGNLLHLGLVRGVGHAAVVGLFLLARVDAQAAQRLGIGLGELGRLGDRRGRKRRASRGLTMVQSK